MTDNVEINEFKDKNVLVVGLGLSGGGVGVVKYLVSQGAKVAVTDQKGIKQLKPSLEKLADLAVKYVLGKKTNPLLLAGKGAKKVHTVVVNPAVDLRSSFIKAVRKKKIFLESEFGIFIKNCLGTIIAVTGTKGKSTVAHLTYEILRRAEKKVFLGGNMGVSLLDKLFEIAEDSYVVLEVSSFQLDLLKESALAFRPHIAALTNIAKDHLDRYDSFSNYTKSKLSIFIHQTNKDFAVIHKSLKSHGSKIKAKKRIFSDLPRFLSAEDVRLAGQHNKENVAAAVEVAQLLNVPQRVIRLAVREFVGLEHRLEFVRYIGGVRFYNDSASTTPASTMLAIESFHRPVILIAGGLNKGLPINDLAKTITNKTKAVFLIGKSAKELQRAIKKAGTKVRIVLCGASGKALKNAVQGAFKEATIGDTVLFSPAYASFDMFENAKERGRLFKELIERLVR